MPEPSPAHHFLDDFFGSYYARRPVNATFIGVHDFDDRLPDFSDNGVGDNLADMRALLERADALDLGPMTPVERTDVRLASGFLRIQLAEFASRHFQAGNPSLYVGEAVFAVLSLFLTDFAPIGERMDAAVSRMEAIPELLVSARGNIREAPASWTERALAECRGALAFLTGGIDQIGGEDPRRAPRLRRAADRAASAVADFSAWLERDLGHARRTDVAIGEDVFALYLRDGHFLSESPDELAGHARAEMEKAWAQLVEGAHAFGAATPDEALAGLADLHPDAAHYHARYQEVWDDMRALADASGLVTWPGDPLRFVPRPAWSREAAPDLYFLFYRSPAAFGRPEVHEHLIAPLPDDADDAAIEAFLRANNDSVIKLNHVVHHAGIGHHVQNGRAFRAPSRIGRVAGVDCASRIAMFSGGTMAEGWACYATDLIREAGGATPLEAYAELRSRTRMCARTVVDVEMHLGRMTLEEAALFYRTHAGMSDGAARNEATKNSMFPAAAVMYLAGNDHIHLLRRDAQARDGADFNLRAFHDRLLSWGSIPVMLAGELMTTGALTTGEASIAGEASTTLGGSTTHGDTA